MRTTLFYSMTREIVPKIHYPIRNLSTMKHLIFG